MDFAVTWPVWSSRAGWLTSLSLVPLRKEESQIKKRLVMKQSVEVTLITIRLLRVNPSPQRCLHPWGPAMGLECHPDPSGWGGLNPGQLPPSFPEASKYIRSLTRITLRAFFFFVFRTYFISVLVLRIEAEIACQMKNPQDGGGGWMALAVPRPRPLSLHPAPAHTSAASTWASVETAFVTEGRQGIWPQRSLKICKFQCLDLYSIPLTGNRIKLTNLTYKWS